MHDILQRVWKNLIGRSTGPMNLRLILQPTVATILAIRAGLADARQRRPAFLWGAISNPAYRREFLRQGWKDIDQVVILSVALDTIYQLIVHRGVYLGELVIVAIVLAIVPYALVRGPVNRVRKKLVRNQDVGDESKPAA